MDQEQIPKLLRLENGKTLVGIVSTKTGQFEIYKPLELVHILDIENRHESISLKPWVFFAEEDKFTIKPQHVISTATLQEQYREMYFEISEKAYSPDEYRGVFSDEEVFSEDENQTIQELYDEVMGMFKDTSKTTIH